MTKKYVLYILLSALAVLLSGCGMNIAIIDNTVIPDADFTAARNLKLMDQDGPMRSMSVMYGRHPRYI